MNRFFISEEQDAAIIAAIEEAEAEDFILAAIAEIDQTTDWEERA